MQNNRTNLIKLTMLNQYIEKYNDPLNLTQNDITAILKIAQYYCNKQCELTNEEILRSRQITTIDEVDNLFNNNIVNVDMTKYLEHTKTLFKNYKEKSNWKHVDLCVLFVFAFQMYHDNDTTVSYLFSESNDELQNNLLKSKNITITTTKEYHRFMEKYKKLYPTLH